MNCIFGLFDVLGFTSFCENCELRSAERVLKVMDDFELEVPDQLLRVLDVRCNTPKDKQEMVKNRLNWLTFSDTIFVAIEVDVSAHPDRLKFDLIFFMVLAAYVNRRMFEIGLPIRGAVHIGDVIVSKRCFAGKAVMDAHRLSSKCQVAATVVSDKANAFLFDTFSEPRGFNIMFSNSVVECDVPTGTAPLSGCLWANTFERMKTLCWFYLNLGEMQPFVIPTDLGTFVREKFTAHGKKLSGEKEKLKALNTERLFQDWQTASKHRYLEQVSMARGQ